MLILGGLVAIPARVLRVDQVIKATAVVVFAVIGLSLVVLTGWAGQISLGQMGFVAIGAAVSATCTSRWNVDLTLALLVGGAAGAVAAFLVGLPALRLRGLYLAVTTLAFALAVHVVAAERSVLRLVPAGQRLERLPLFGRIDLSTPTRYYVFTLVVFGARVLGAARHPPQPDRAGDRRHARERAGRAGFAVSAVPAKLTAFTISGAVAGIAGGLFVHLNQAFSLASYGPGQSLERVHRRRRRRARLASAAPARRACTSAAPTGSSPRPSGSCCRPPSACCSSC